MSARVEPAALALSGVGAGAAREKRFRAMFDQNAVFIWRVARRFGLDDAGADDVTQEVFVVAARRLDEIRPDAERSFLLGAALKLAASARRARLRAGERHAGEGPLAHAPDDGPTPEQAAAARRGRALLDAILAGMDEDTRVAFVLFEVEGMTKTEIASALSVPEGTVASRIRRGREEFFAAAKRWKAKLRVEGKGP